MMPRLTRRSHAGSCGGAAGALSEDSHAATAARAFDVQPAYIERGAHTKEHYGEFSSERERVV